MNRIEGDTHVAGTLTAQSLVPSSGSVTNTAVSATAAIVATKLQQQRVVTYSQESTTDATVERKVIHVVNGATGTVVSFKAGSVSVASGGGNAVIDLLKNGTTILSATITLDNVNTVYVVESASGFTSTSLVVGDVLEFKITSVASTKPKGVFCQLVLTEDPA
jgi:hypothetical protein